MIDIEEYAVIYPSPREETDGVNDVATYSLLMRPDSASEDEDIFEYPLSGEQARPLRNRYRDDGSETYNDVISLYDAALTHSNNTVTTVSCDTDEAGWMKPAVLTIETPLKASGGPVTVNLPVDVPTGLAIGIGQGAEIRIDDSLFGPDEMVQQEAGEYFDVFSRGGHRYRPVTRAETRAAPVSINEDAYEPADIGMLDRELINTYIEDVVDATDQQVVTVTPDGQQLDPTSHPQLQELAEKTLFEAEEGLRKDAELLMAHFRRVETDDRSYVLHAPIEEFDEAAVKTYYRHNGGTPDVMSDEIDTVGRYTGASLFDELLGTTDEPYQIFIEAGAPAINDQISESFHSDIETVPTAAHVRIGDDAYEIPVEWVPTLVPADDHAEVMFRHSTDIADEYTLDLESISTDEEDPSASRGFQ